METKKCICGQEGPIRVITSHQARCPRFQEWELAIATDTQLIGKLKGMGFTQLKSEATRLGIGVNALREMIDGTWLGHAHSINVPRKPTPVKSKLTCVPNIPSLDASGEEILLALRDMLDAYKARGKEIVRLNERITILEAELKKKNDLTTARYSAQIESEIIKQGKE
jgi:hypothetical protein